MTQARARLGGLLGACILSCTQMPATAATQGSCAPAAIALPGDGPTEIVRAAALGMLGDLDKNRDAYRRDPAAMSGLVDKYLLPHFDTAFAARLVLGRHWSSATPEQRQHFIAAFYHSLVSNYGTALADFTCDRLEIIPTKVDRDATVTTVRTKIRRNDGAKIDIYYELHKTPEGWKAWNMVIEGVSYVNIYREDLSPQIEQQGIDAVIRRLESGQQTSPIGSHRDSKGS